MSKPMCRNPMCERAPTYVVVFNGENFLVCAHCAGMVQVLTSRLFTHCTPIEKWEPRCEKCGAPLFVRDVGFICEWCEEIPQLITDQRIEEMLELPDELLVVLTERFGV